MRGSREGGGRGYGPLPLKITKVGFLSNIGPDPLKITKLPSQHSMLGHHLHVPVSETPFKRRFAGGPMMARFNGYLDSLSPHKKTTKKRCQSWTPSGNTFWIRAWFLNR